MMRTRKKDDAVRPRSKFASGAVLLLLVLLLAASSVAPAPSESALAARPHFPPQSPEARTVGALDHLNPIATHTSNAGPAEAGYETANLTVGTVPVGVLFDPIDGKVFVTNFGSNNITVINSTSDLEEGSIKVVKGPITMAMDIHDDLVYVIEQAANALAVVRGSTNKVIATVPTGVFPQAVAYDSANGYVYVANEQSSNISVVNGSTHKSVGSIPTPGIGPQVLVYDAANGYLYVADKGLSYIEMVNVSQSQVVGTIPVGTEPVSMACDDQTGDIYVANQGSENVTIIQGSTNLAAGSVSLSYSPTAVAIDDLTSTGYAALGSGYLSVFNLTNRTVSASIAVGSYPYGVAVAPSTDRIFIANSGDNTLTFAAPDLSGAIDSSPNPTDVGLNVSLEARFAGGLPPCCSISWMFGDGSALTGSTLNTSHSYEAAGQYVVSIAATDGNGYEAFANATVTVHPPIRANAPRASEQSGDVGEVITFVSNTSGGTPPYETFNWSGISGDCSNVTTGRPACLFGSAGNLSVSDIAVDSLGARSPASPTLRFRVYDRPEVETPNANRSSVDVGQPISLSAVVVGGSGNFTNYRWSGLSNGTCIGTSTGRVDCVFGSAENLSVSVTAADQDGGTASGSPALRLEVYQLPDVLDVTVNRSTADEGQLVRFAAEVVGGFGSYSFAWNGLPSGCASATELTVACVVAGPGAITVGLVVTDANGGKSEPSPTARVMAYRDPIVSAPVLTSDTVQVGQKVEINSTVEGGWGTYAYSWLGLPAGCTTVANLATCQPLQSGTYSVGLTITDSDNFTVTSTLSALTVLPLPATPAPTMLGVSSAVFTGVLLVGAALVVVVVVILLRMRVSKDPPGPARPPTPPASGGGS
jgi:YVTN family beta-propeller protein